MYKKLCPKCHQPSFSSCESGKWICPICQKDLTHISRQDAESRQNTKSQLILIVNRLAEQTRNSDQPQQQSFNKYM